jgi:hypothetical protein
MTDVHSPSLVEAGAPEHEIEITPEMIEAGALALSEYTHVLDTREEGAEKIYRRMEDVRLGRAKNYCSRF